MSKVIVTLMLCVYSAGMAGCAAEDSPPIESPLDGSPEAVEATLYFEESVWEVVAFGSGGPEVVAGSAPTLEFGREAGSVNGSGGCNRFRGPFSLESNQITFGLMAATMMACADEALNLQEQAFMAALDAAAGLARDGDSLSLHDAEGSLLLRLKPRVELALSGTEWVLTGYNNGKEAVVSVMTDTAILVTFDSDSISGSAGCNQFRAACAVTGEAIEIGMPAATSKFCGEPEGVMDQEMAFLAALPSAAIFRIEGDQLDLRTSEGDRVAVFSAAEP